jgi:hypothetical protein
LHDCSYPSGPALFNSLPGIALLQRFGEDLLDVVNYLEEQGIPHRDIKLDNIGVGLSAAVTGCT